MERLKLIKELSYDDWEMIRRCLFLRLLSIENDIKRTKYEDCKKLYIADAEKVEKVIKKVVKI